MKKTKNLKKFIAEFKNGSQIVIKAESRREAIDDAIEFTWTCGDMLDVREIKNA